MQRILLIVLALLTAGTTVYAFAPNNFFPPYDPNLRMPSWEDNKFWKKCAWRLGANVEVGSTGNGRSFDDHKANVLQIYDETQAIIPMLIGNNIPAAEQLLQDLTAAYPGQPLDDGTRGHLKFSGRFDMADVTLHGRYWLPIDFAPGYFSLNVALPIRCMQIENPVIQDLTKDIFAVDLDIKAQLSNPSVFAQQLKKLGSLDVGAWSKTGVGDLMVLLEWHNYYRQEKENLRNVLIFTKLGVLAPTAGHREEDRALSMSLGNDGAWGIPFGLGLTLDFVYSIRFGLDAEFLVLFDETHTRRLKTDPHQTEFLLLKKGDATKEHGLTWKFNLFLQAYHFWRGLSFKTAYHYVKHDDDRLSATTNEFSYSVINSANSLLEWNMHHLIFQLNYDLFNETRNWVLKPQFSFFYKLPIAGKGVIQPHTFGGQFSFNF